MGYLRRGADVDHARVGNLRGEYNAVDRQAGGYLKKRESGGAEEIDSPDRRITYERWFSIAVGQMGMRPDDFDAMTPAGFIYAWLGWMEHQESRMRQAWERERWAVWVLTSIQIDRKDRQPMTQMFPLPWECQPAHGNNELTMEERLERVNRILKKNSDENNKV